jgi:hypothetical protein
MGGIIPQKTETRFLGEQCVGSEHVSAPEAHFSARYEQPETGFLVVA